MIDRVEQLTSAPSADERRGAPSEFAGRLAVAASLIALFYALWLVNLPWAAEWTSRPARILPRLSVFGLGLFVALTLQGCQIRQRVLALCTVAAGLGLVWLHFNTASQFEIVKVHTDAVNARGMVARDWAGAGQGFYFHARPDMFETGAVLLLLRFGCAVFGAVFLGTWIGRGVRRPWHFVALVLFGAVCDFWLNWFHVADRVNGFSFLSVLRLPFVPVLGGISAGPAFTDLVFASAMLESARAFRLHTLSLVLGAMAGYCSGALLGLEPTPGWTHLNMALLACGVLAAAWPDLKLDSNSIGKMFLTVALLIMAECSLIWVEHKLNPQSPPNKIEELDKMRNVAIVVRASSLRLEELDDAGWKPAPQSAHWQKSCVHFEQGCADIS